MNDHPRRTFSIELDRLPPGHADSVLAVLNALSEAIWDAHEKELVEQVIERSRNELLEQDIDDLAARSVDRDDDVPF